MPELEVGELRRLFPRLSKELLNESYKVRELFRDPLAGYEPSVYDFLCRARTIEDGLRVIEYMEMKGELSPEQANVLRDKLMREGLSSFGERREFGYYYRLAANKRRELLSRSERRT